ncbi:PadR family transcriptional regulator [Allokutzneria oryzae]|uniref:PadR family transcriptional regulator n=1 Tax=Allokutzneria oryzae TaxID=1378989 RepID=A0ABV6A4L6_9PSEU
MSATRLLVLGVVRAYGRAHGYLVRNELVSWGAEEWANIKWGSLYHALRQLDKDGLLAHTDIEEWPGRVDYYLTEQGEAAFHEMLREALRTPEHRPDLLVAGVALLPALTREDAISLLLQRIDALEKEREEKARFTSRAGGGEEPEHFRELSGLWVHAADRGVEWTRELVERLREGAYVMAGEPGHTFGAAKTWQTP